MRNKGLHVLHVQQLRDRHATALVISDMMTHICIDSTVRAAGGR